jgi:hypothetical protein
LISIWIAVVLIAYAIIGTFLSTGLISSGELSQNAKETCLSIAVGLFWPLLIIAVPTLLIREKIENKRKARKAEGRRRYETFFIVLGHLQLMSRKAQSEAFKKIHDM